MERIIPVLRKKCPVCKKIFLPRDPTSTTEGYCSYDCAKIGQPESVKMAVGGWQREN